MLRVGYIISYIQQPWSFVQNLRRDEICDDDDHKLLLSMSPIYEFSEVGHIDEQVRFWSEKVKGYGHSKTIDKMVK